MSQHRARARTNSKAYLRAPVIMAASNPLRGAERAWLHELKNAGVDLTAIRHNGLIRGSLPFNAIR